MSVDPDSDTEVDPLDSATVKPGSASAVPEKGPSKKKTDANIKPVSYTHLTLPTKRIE